LSFLSKTEYRNPWAWVPTLYFAEGIPYITVMIVSVIMYKRLGISNTDIALYTSWLYLPWVIKPLWSPVVDIVKTKRFWIVLMQLLVSAGLLGIGLTLHLPNFFLVTLIIFWFLAFSSATHDIAADGFYMLGLNQYDQSFFVGIRSTFYRLASITGQGLVVILAGYLENRTKNISSSWSITFIILAALFLCMILFLFKVRKKYFILIGFVILILILVVFNSSIPVQRLLSIFSFSQPSNVARINEIVTVNNLLQGNFWSLLFGEGLGAIRPFYGLLSEYNWMNFYTHNYYLKLIVNQGVIGLLFFLSFNLNLVNKAISLVDPKGTSLGLTLACISLLITGLFGLVFENFPLDFYYWLFTGTLRAIIIIDKQENAEHAT